MRIWIAIILSIVIGAIFWPFGRNVDMKTQIELYKAIQSISVVVFGVMGAWIALVFPDILTRAKEGTEDGVFERIRVFNWLIASMVTSTSVLLIAFIVQISDPILKQFPILILNKSVVRSASFSMVGFLASIEFWCVLMTLVPLDYSKEALYSAKNRLKTIRSKNRILRKRSGSGR